MRFFDWLFGRSNIGWLKTALLSGFIGILVLFLLYGSDVLDTYQDGSSKWYFILAGYPILSIIRKVYWKFRGQQIQKLFQKNDPKAMQHLFSYTRWAIYSKSADLVSDLIYKTEDLIQENLKEEEKEKKS